MAFLGLCTVSDEHINHMMIERSKRSIGAANQLSQINIIRDTTSTVVARVAWRLSLTISPVPESFDLSPIPLIGPRRFAPAIDSKL